MSKISAGTFPILPDKISREVFMAEVIDIRRKPHGMENLIADRPLEWRRGDWHTGAALLCTATESARFEAHRKEALQVDGHSHIATVPNHFKLDGGYHYTTLGLFRHRNDETMMRRVYQLAG
jgi:hypothetical protein